MLAFILEVAVVSPQSFILQSDTLPFFKLVAYFLVSEKRRPFNKIPPKAINPRVIEGSGT